MSTNEEIEEYNRISLLYGFGHFTLVWSSPNKPSPKGHVVEIRHPSFVSRPCWREIMAAADLIENETIRFADYLTWADDEEVEDIYQFYFQELDTARQLAARVTDSARNKRKDLDRRILLDKAGGFHNQWAIDQLFDIQKGLCYYTGDRLTKSPKNFVKDHLVSVVKGGTDWPGNLALTTWEANRLKGGSLTPAAFLEILAEQRGPDWYRHQLTFCKEVDTRRMKLDLEFRLRFK